MPTGSIAKPGKATTVEDSKSWLPPRTAQTQYQFRTAVSTKTRGGGAAGQVPQVAGDYYPIFTVRVGKIKAAGTGGQSSFGLHLLEDPAHSPGTPLCPGFEKSILDACPNRRDQAGAASWIGS